MYIPSLHVGCHTIAHTHPSTPHSGTFRVVLDSKIKSIRDDGEVYFACSVGRHCASGKQIVEFLVDCDSNSTVAAPAPAPRALTAFG